MANDQSLVLTANSGLTAAAIMTMIGVLVLYFRDSVENKEQEG